MNKTHAWPSPELIDRYLRNVLRAAALCLSALSLALASAAPAYAQSLPAAAAQTLERDINDILRRTNVPSASIAIVQDGRIIHAQAYGRARLEPATNATPDMSYAIGSISKQFTASAILMLASEGRLSLDDPIERFLPGFTAGDQITVRRLLTHSAGYADYWPVDYVTDEQKRAVSPAALAAQWAGGPLDFQPGEAARYCNTCYVIAGLIIEKVSGQSLDDFLSERIFRRLGMDSAVDIDLRPLTANEPQGHLRYAFGPVRPATPSGAGWLFATGQLAMNARDLARWDVAMIDRSLLTPSSYEEQFSVAKLNNGSDTIYGLGVEVRRIGGRSVLQHAGTVSGFTAYNRIYPDDRAAVVVMVNADFGGSARDAIVKRVTAELFPPDAEEVGDREMYDMLRAGQIDRSRMTAHANEYFTPQVLADYRASLDGLGDPISFTLAGRWNRGGLIGEAYNVGYSDRTLQFSIFKTRDGKYEEAFVYPPN